VHVLPEPPSRLMEAVTITTFGLLTQWYLTGAAWLFTLTGVTSSCEIGVFGLY
jgi:hypothetical protein